MAQKHCHVINSEKFGGQDGIERGNPANTGEVIGLFPKATQEIAKVGIEAAALAQPGQTAIDLFSRSKSVHVAY